MSIDQRITPAADAWIREGGRERDDDYNACTMNINRAARVKGAPLSRVEVERILTGRERWNGRPEGDDRPSPEDQDPPTP